MRPVLLEMEGFASFRERAEVRFDDADYFALIGPTGSGKSTVIDAMTFALYGSVARWGHEGMVSPALAPTVNRGVVRLVFDVAGARYSVVREVRRSGGKNPGVGMKSSRLELFADRAALGEPGDETVVLASDREVDGEIERLLGLTFKHFCACVALPQGEFAEFLHAKASDRQRILVKLLGWEVYDRIARGAGARAGEQRQRAETLSGQLNGYVDATEEEVAGLAGQIVELRRLNDRVVAALPVLAAAATKSEAVRKQVRTLTEQNNQLAQVEVPEHIADLEQVRRTAIRAHATAAESLEAAQAADDAARAALQGAPGRTPLEQARQQRAELADTVEALAELEKARRETEEDLRSADAAAQHAEAAVTRARAASDGAGRSAEEAETRATATRTEHDRLAAVTQPRGLAEIAAAGGRAAELVKAAATRIATAEEADELARNVLNMLPTGSLLGDARRHADDIHRIGAAQLTASAEIAAQRGKLAQASADLTAATARLTAAQEAVDLAERTDHALVLREHLTAGLPCPVCEQEVSALPSLTGTASVTGAREQLGAARRDVDLATEAERTLERLVDRACDSRTSALASAEVARQAFIAIAPAALGAAPATDVTAVLHRPLTTEVSDNELDQVVAAVSALAERLASAEKARAVAQRRAAAAAAELTAARADLAAAQRTEADAMRAVTAAREHLRRARDPLVVLDAPLVDETDVGAAWDQLIAWAREQAAERAAVLPELAKIAESAAALDVTTSNHLTDTVAELERCRAAATDTRVALQDVLTRLDGLSRRRDELQGLLASAPSDEDIRRRLSLIDELEAEAQRTGAGLRSSRADLAQAVQDLRAVEQTVARARRELSRARDPLANLGAPEVADGDLLAAWATLADWAMAEVGARAEQLDAATNSADQAQQELERGEQELCADLLGSGIECDGTAPLRESVPVLVATALARAEGAHQRMTERVAAADALRRDIETAQDESRVAKLLADLMRSDAFQRWLVASAIDTLVTEASASLFELSGGQFDLCHVDGAFHVIDHNEAGARRPVKTLSGGETFQASLALALALSSQMRSLAAAGAAELDSIFLDEGFGTLDQETLDTVASTLESLATSGSRMVGVITHVGALAERVPVRYLVTRDAASSRVAREAL